METVLRKLQTEFSNKRCMANPLLLLSPEEMQELALYVSCNPYGIPQIGFDYSGFTFNGVRIAEDSGNIIHFPKARKYLNLVG